MAEARQTIIERVARFAMELIGAEEVERKLEAVDERFLRTASGMQSNIKIMRELSAAFRTLGRTMSGTVLQQLPQTTEFLTRYAIAGEKADVAGREFSLAMYAQSEEGRNLATSLGLVVPKMEETETVGDRLKSSFWSLNSAARALLRVFVAFKLLTGVAKFFADIAVASAELQAELWRLEVTQRAVLGTVEEGGEAWEDWLERIDRLRQALPYVSTKEIVEGLRKITVILGPLGLAGDELERLLGLIGQMSLVAGQDFIPFVNQILTAFTGMGRNVASLNIDLREGSMALQRYAEEAGFVWDELDTTTKQYIRMAYFVDEATKRIEDVTEAESEQFVQLEKLRAARQDIIAQSPQLIKTHVLWETVLLTITDLLVRVAEKVNELIASILAFGMSVGVITRELGIVRGLRAVIFGPEEEEDVERFSEIYTMLREGLLGVGEGAEEAGEEIDGLDQEIAEATTEAERLEAELLELAKAQEQAKDTADEFGEAITRALKQAQSALRSYQRAVEQAGIRLARRLADIIRNLEERLADLEARFEARRDQLIRRFEDRRAEIREDAAEKEEELRKDLNKRLRRMEEDHQNEMRELREDYLLDLEEAARKRDAVSMRRIQQRYILEKKQRERDHEIRRRRAIEDYHEQLDELRKAREEQERELEKSLERQLQELQENYERQQEEARLNAERQREDALRNYQEQLNDLWRSFQDRLETIALNLMEEEEEWKEHLGDLRIFFDRWYEDDLVALKAWLTKRAIILRAQEWIESLPPWMRPFIPPIPQISMAQGGAGVARSPTQITVGESGAEMFAAWPLGQRMPRLGADIRLTIDGTQTGEWSAGFESQVVRILREVLEEAL